MFSPGIFDRTTQINRLALHDTWDVVIIGGGATGLGIALDAASRGFTTVLLEQHDFAKGTSSRSTKLVHGGVRYLAQGDLKLVYSALHERNILARNAAHVVKRQSFIVPCYSWWELLKYGTGLKLYDLLSGRYSLGRSKLLGRRQLLNRLPKIAKKKLKGGIEYFDGQFDDARLAVNLAQTAIEHGALVLNYFAVTGLTRSDAGQVTGVVATDVESGIKHSVKARAVINATGVFVDEILRMDEPGRKKLVTPSRGVHLVVDRKYLDSGSALMIPKTSDGRVLFVVPWHGHLVVGTTDTPIQENTLETSPENKEVEFILDNIRKYLPEPPGREDVLSVFSGLRPLAAAATSDGTPATKELSRDHKLLISKSGLITITGGKWTTYRKMAEETIDAAISNGSLPAATCHTEDIRLHGCSDAKNGRLSIYGSDARSLEQMMTSPEDSSILVHGHPYTIAEVKWAIRFEMARTVEDVLARRLRLLFLDADAAIEAAPMVASIIGKERNLDEKSIREQLDEFYKIAAHYQLTK